MGVKASKLSKIIGLPGAALAPKGYVPNIVGMNSETKLFMVHTTALGDADFLELLCRSAEEYNEGILRIPCETEAFEELMMINGGSSKLKIPRVRPT